MVWSYGLRKMYADNAERKCLRIIYVEKYNS
jgi:hypothetical protein